MKLIEIDKLKRGRIYVDCIYKVYTFKYIGKQYDGTHQFIFLPLIMSTSGPFYTPDGTNYYWSQAPWYEYKPFKFGK